jgi:hypothetical protein
VCLGRVPARPRMAFDHAMRQRDQIAALPSGRVAACDPVGGVASTAAKAAGVIAIVTIGRIGNSPWRSLSQGPAAPRQMLPAASIHPWMILYVVGAGPKRHPANVADDAGDKSRFALRQGGQRSRGDRP